MSTIRLASLSLLVLLFAFTGCNSFSGLGGESDEPKELLQDANAALQNDHPDKAVKFLRKAVKKDDAEHPHPIYRTRLSTALLEQRDISVVDFLRISDKVTNDLDANTSRALGKRLAGSCSFNQSYDNEQFDPTDISNFGDIEGSAETLREVRSLVNRVLADNRDAQPDEFDGTAIEQSIERLRDAGLTDEEIAEALMNDAIAYTALAYVDIAKHGSEDFSFYYVTSPSNVKYLGYCAPDQGTLDDVLGSVACQVANISRTVDLVTARANLLESERAAEITDDAKEALQRLDEELDATCPAEANWSAPAARNVEDAL